MRFKISNFRFNSESPKIIIFPVAFQYADNGNSRSEYKAVLVTRVVLGNPQKLVLEDWFRCQPDMGYDSVEAHPLFGGPTEVVVFNHNAARPAYLIIAK
ncbi:hypothetical protein IW262DRAFT_1323692 [Armillaria fumosa]|nr:hypothetical protein IW262DRAFT_1323692 [Armillaria fumosa]